MLGIILNKIFQLLSMPDQISKPHTANPSQDLFNKLIKIYQLGQISKAERMSRKLLKKFPKSPAVMSILGATLVSQGKFKNALHAYNKIIQLDPNHAETYFNRGIVFQKLRQFQDSIDSYGQAIKLKPNYPQAFNNRGYALQELDNLDQAIDNYTQAVLLKPDYAEALYNTGVAFQTLEKFQDSIDSYNRAIKLQPNYPQAFNNRGYALQELGNLDQAIDSYNQAILLKPDYFEAYYNQGSALEDLRKIDEAINSYTKAIQTKKNDVEARWNLSLLLIMTGDLKNGWQEYEFGKLTDKKDRRLVQTPYPLWKGENLSEKEILITAEQGIGDEIMFASIIPEFEHLAEKVVIECAMKLALIFQWAFPWAEVKETGPVKCEHIAYYNEFDYQIPSGSIARFFRRSIADFEHKQKPFIPRLKQGEKKVRDNLKLTDNQLLIGLCWRSSLQTVERNIHYLEVEELAPLKAIKNATFLAVQYDDCLPELDRVRDLGLSIHYYTNIDQKGDLGSTCALLGACDLVISAATAAAQMAAALGVPTLIFSPTGHFKKTFQAKRIPWHPTIQFLELHPYHHDRLLDQILKNFPTYIDWANRVTSSHRRVML